MTLERVEYATRTATWETPRGRLVEFAYRAETSDWNTISSIMRPHDEYGLGALQLTGLALDIGAHIGAASIALAADNPELRVIAVEAIAENAELARENAARNGLSDRITVLTNAAAAPGIDTTEVLWRSTGSENATHHAFIGNSRLVYDTLTAPHETATVACVSLEGLLEHYHYMTPAAFMKIDCEGCEWGFLSDPAIMDVERITGEWHPTGGHTLADIVKLLSPTHDVDAWGEGPGGFRAVRR